MGDHVKGVSLEILIEISGESEEKEMLFKTVLKHLKVQERQIHSS